MKRTAILTLAAVLALVFVPGAVAGAATDRKPPRTKVLVPAPNATLSGLAVLAATATDNVGVTRVEYRLFGNRFFFDYGIGVATPLACCGWVLFWNTLPFPNGNYVLTSKAFDAAGNSAYSPNLNVSIGNPTFTVTPKTGLTDGQSVTVRGAGLILNQPVVMQCGPMPANTFFGCDPSTLLPVTLDSSGSFVTPFPVKRFLETFGTGNIDCGVLPDFCRIALYAGGGGVLLMQVRLQFAT